MTNGIIVTSNTPQRDSASSVARRSTLRTDPIRTGPIATVATTAAAPTTRRAAREAGRAAERAAVKAAKGRNRSVKKTVVSVAAMTLTAGLFGTMAAPAFAHPASTATGSSAESAAVAAERANGAQNVSVASDAKTASVSRDDYTTTVPVAKVASTPTTSTVLSASATATAEASRASFAQSTAYDGKTAADYLADPAHPAFSLAAVYQTALQYVGTPYVFGGATPAGFDCSGFVMYVYAQYGISLQHSVPLEDAAGTQISEADAEPGDLVVFDNEEHIGFYAGNGMILDAPKPGGSVSVRPIWNQAHHFVRLGI